VITCTEWASDILRKSVAAAKRFDPSAGIRLARQGSGVVFALAAGPVDGDAVVEGDGFVLWAEAGLAGTVDVVEPHDQLILRPPGDTARSVRA
jgi:hypothetical protein